jgi:hypothetical protein
MVPAIGQLVVLQLIKVRSGGIGRGIVTRHHSRHVMMTRDNCHYGSLSAPFP